MQTIRLWLEPDPEIPRFQRLKHEIVDVPLADVFQKGIHPWGSGNRFQSLTEKFLEIINKEDMALPEIKPFGYCEPLADPLYGFYSAQESMFAVLLRKVSQDVYFVEALTFKELVALAKERLRKNWCNGSAFPILSKACGGFNEMRSFLKRKDKNLKLSRYTDIEDCDLAGILDVEDFESHEKVLISEGLRNPNFRSTQFLERVTGEHGHLKVTDRIRDFGLTVTTDTDGYPEKLVYNGQADGNHAVLRPVLNHSAAKRALAQDIASKWRTDNSRYCFSTSIERLSRMLELKEFTISFPTLDYMKAREAKTSTAELQDKGIQVYTVGKYLTEHDSGERIKNVLRDHQMTMTGRKEQLLEKLAQLAVQVYQDKAAELDAYFSQNRFVSVKEERVGVGQIFPVLEDLDIGQLILAMYVLKHQRGNAILEAGHKNDTYELIDLARSVINREVAPEGCFMRVQ